MRQIGYNINSSKSSDSLRSTVKQDDGGYMQSELVEKQIRYLTNQIKGT